MIKRKFSGKRLIKLIKIISFVWFILYFLVAFFVFLPYLRYQISGCPNKFSRYLREKSPLIEFCGKYDFLGKWGYSGTDWEGTYHRKGDYTMEDCVKAYEKQEILEVVPYYGDPPEGIKEKIMKPPNFRGMMGIRVVGEERKAPPTSRPSECSVDYSFEDGVIGFVFFLVIGIAPLFALYGGSWLFKYLFPEERNKKLKR
ncbi:hypothetical protein ACFLZP_02440 [Patescibacteria group bacterium]